MAGDTQEEEWKTITKNDKKRIARGRNQYRKGAMIVKEGQIDGFKNDSSEQKPHMTKSELDKVISLCLTEIQSTKFLIGLEETVLLNGSSTSPSSSSIVCYGIGNFGIKQSIPSASMWQLVCALQLRDTFQKKHGIEVILYYFEPFMTSEEANLLKHLSIEIIHENEKGKRTVTETTFFFMPHCPLVLYSNLIFENRNHLQHVIIFGNSLSSYANRLQQNCITKFLQLIQPFWDETTICLPKDEVTHFSGQFEQAFNDQSITRFMETGDLNLPQELVDEMMGNPEDIYGEVV